MCQIMRRKAAIKKKKLNVVKGGLATSVSFGYNQVASARIERMNFIRRAGELAMLPVWQH